MRKLSEKKASLLVQLHGLEVQKNLKNDSSYNVKYNFFHYCIIVAIVCLVYNNYLSNHRHSASRYHAMMFYKYANPCKRVSSEIEAHSKEDRLKLLLSSNVKPSNQDDRLLLEIYNRRMSRLNEYGKISDYHSMKLRELEKASKR